MKFIDLLDVLESDAQLSVIVTNEWGDRFYEGTVEKLREEELLLDLRVELVRADLIGNIEKSDYYPDKVSFFPKNYVTLFDDEHKIIYRGCKQVY